jgi:hypothetical protein
VRCGAWRAYLVDQAQIERAKAARAHHRHGRAPAKRERETGDCVEVAVNRSADAGKTIRGEENRLQSALGRANSPRSHAVTCQNETFQTGKPKTKARSSVTAQDRAFLLPISRREAHDAGGGKGSMRIARQRNILHRPALKCRMNHAPCGPSFVHLDHQRHRVARQVKCRASLRRCSDFTFLAFSFSRLQRTCLSVPFVSFPFK